MAEPMAGGGDLIKALLRRIGAMRSAPPKPSITGGTDPGSAYTVPNSAEALARNNNLARPPAGNVEPMIRKPANDYANGGAVNAALRLARQAGGAANRDPNYEVAGPNYSGPTDAAQRSPEIAAIKEIVDALHHRAGASRQEFDKLSFPDQASMVGKTAGPIAVEMTGIPSIYRGASKVVDPDSDMYGRVAGGGEALLGAIPGMAALKPAWSMGRPMLAGTVAGLAEPLRQDLPKIIDAARQYLPNLTSPASAGESGPRKYEGPARPPAEINAIQQRLKDAGYAIKVDGVDKGGTRDAEFDFAKKEAMRERQLALEEERVRAAQKASEAQSATAHASEKKTAAETEAANKLAADRNTYGAKLNEREKNLGPWESALRTAGPYIGMGAGALLGTGFGALSNKLGGMREGSKIAERNALLKMPRTTKGDFPDTNKEISNLNRFYSEGSPAGAKVPFSETGKEPFWKANAKGVPPATDLYPAPSRGVEYGLNAGVGTGIGAIEWERGHAMKLDAINKLREAEAAHERAPSDATVQAILDAKYRRSLGEAMEGLGIGSGSSQVLKGSQGIWARPEARPAIQAAGAQRAKLQAVIADKKEAANAARIAAANKAAKAKGKRPNGSGAAGLAPLVPLTTMPLVGSGERSSQEPAPDALPNSEEGFQRGGIVGQALRIAKQNGGAAQKGAFLGDRESENVETGKSMPKWDEFMSNLGTILGGGYGSLGEGDEKRLSRINPPDEVRRIMEAQRNRRVYPPAPDLLPGPRGSSSPREYQTGGAVVHAGPIQHDAAGGRTDTVPLDVAAGSYVIPADIISGIGQGDTTAGYKALSGMFGPQSPKPAPAAGGAPVPILAAGGEFVISPDVVAKIGKGDLKGGHEALDLWVKMQRRKIIQELKKLPGPSKD